MNNAASLGMNRTGIDMSPVDAAKMTDLMESFTPPPGSEQWAMDFRSEFIANAEPIGSIPLPGTVKGMAKTVLHKLMGDRPEVFLDKLGERIAFERTGVRLYGLLIQKCRESPDELPSSSVTTLEQIQAEELRHFQLTSDVMLQIGGDPTAMTPGADVHGVMALGLMQTLADPRTTVSQGLEAILLAELADNDAWGILIRLAEEQGLEPVAADFREAEAAEMRHLAEIRELVSQVVLNEAFTTH